MNDTHADPDLFQIEAHTSLAESLTRVLKHGDTFGIFEAHGDVLPSGHQHNGIFHEGTRFLSKLELTLGATRPLLLSSTVKKDNLMLAVDLTNPDLRLGGLHLPQGMLHLFRSKFLWGGVCYERIKITSYADESITAGISFRFAADFLDIFELRGMPRARRGRMLAAEVEAHGATLRYLGLDGVLRRTLLSFGPAPLAVSGTEARFELVLAPRTEQVLFVCAGFETGAERRHVLSYDQAFQEMTHAAQALHLEQCRIVTSNIQFNQWLDRSTADLEMMLSETPWGWYPYAGVPWYSTIFGRDGLITALELLWTKPEVARGVLAYLAAHQADQSDDDQESDPGKILHEARQGEMAALREVPFWRYYGSIDSTPLFLMLAGAFLERTGDLDFMDSIWPSLVKAMAWIERYADVDGDGFVEYQQRSESGLRNQGWKDSVDAVFGADGALAEGPIALSEVQAYIYAARLAMAAMARARGDKETAGTQERAAHRLREKFRQDFWSDDLGMYVLGLDGHKKPLAVRTSNAGHALFAGIATEAHARAVAERLLSPAFFSGWGIRTVAATEVRYNPMSYHNGSVWPHDNALIAVGLARYGHGHKALRILEGLFDATRFMDLNRLPELFCGFVRREEEAPTLYPVACSPQAWAAGAVFMLLQACLGVSVEAGPPPRLLFKHPNLPAFLQEVRLDNLRVGEAVVDLSVRRYREDVGIHVLSRTGTIEIVVTK